MHSIRTARLPALVAATLIAFAIPTLFYAQEKPMKKPSIVLVHGAFAESSSWDGVVSELRARGYHARGVDEDGYADWINRISGRADAFPRDAEDFDFHAWYAAHYWVLSVRRISRLSRAAARLGEPVFLCGSASGDDVVWQLFDKVIALVADERTIRQRLATRPDGFGTTPEELADVLFWHAGFESAYRGFGATIIDATVPLPDVVAEVLAAVPCGR